MKKLFVPNKANNYKPHFFRNASIALMSFVVALVAGLTFTGGTMLQRADFLAEIRTAFLIDLANEDRSDSDLHALTKSPILTEAARLKASHMAENGYFEHTSPDGVKPWDWFEKVNYDYAYAGENLAIHFVDSGKVHEAWMNSPSHRANIMQGKFTEIGIATVEGQYNGHPTTFVVQMFGRPRASTVASRDVSLIRDVNAWTAERYLTRLLGPLGEINKFEAGDRVRVDTKRLNVRSAPGGTRIDQVTLGAVGTVISGPKLAKGLAWYNIDFYDKTNTLLSSNNEATVLGQTITTQDNNTITGPGTSVFSSSDPNENVAAPIVIGINTDAHTNTWQRWLISPYKTGHNVFIFLAGIMALALALLIGIEIKRQHYRYISLGIVLFVILVGLIIISIMADSGNAVLIR